jgi:hypothetical protein
MAKPNKKLRKTLKDQGYKPEVIDKIIDLYMRSSKENLRVGSMVGETKG